MMEVKKTSLGYEFETSDYFILWGGVEANIENLRTQYPQFLFTRIKQVHSDIVVKSELNSDWTQTADAHWTHEPGHALCVSTADCVPILIYSPRKKIVAAIHAGWRGVANRIFPITLHTLRNQNIELEHLHVFMGPHILKPSFEVENTVANQILSTIKLNTSSKLGTDFFEWKNDSKLNLDLYKILLEQARLEGLPESHIKTFLRDTKTDLEFHSHRRDKEKSGRQLSFIVLK